MYVSVIWKESGKEKAEESSVANVIMNCAGIHGKARREEPDRRKG